jgi:hypothetical protein
MSEPLTERTVVVGNSGSGKSTLAEAIADIPAIDLDLLHWEGTVLAQSEMKPSRERWFSIFQISRAGSSKVHSDDLRKSPFPKQPLSFGWIFPGAFAALVYWLAVCGEEQQIMTPPN